MKTMQLSNERTNRIAAISRRTFLKFAAAPFVIPAAGFAGEMRQESVVPARETKKSGIVELSDSGETLSSPLYISQASYPFQAASASGLAELIKISKDAWRFNGLELSMSMIAAASNGDQQAFLGECKSEVSKLGTQLDSTPLTLSVNLDDASRTPEQWLEYASQTVQSFGISICSVSLPENLELTNIADQITAWQQGIVKQEATKSTRVMLETPVISSGMEFLRLASIIQDVSEDVGILIKSASTKYRFDLAVQDLQFALRRNPDSNNAKRKFAARFQIGDLNSRTASQLAFEREMFHRAIVEQFAPQAKDKMLPQFISLQSAMPLKWEKQQSGKRQTSLGSNVFHDVMNSFRHDLSKDAA